MFTNECGDGTTYSGLCPGGSNFKCCIKKTQVTGVGTACSDQNIAGKCIDTNVSGCSTTLVTGKCPGPANVKCCLNSNPPPVTVTPPPSGNSNNNFNHNNKYEIFKKRIIK